MNKKKSLLSILAISFTMIILSGCGVNSQTTEVANTEETTEPIDNSGNMNIMTEEELLEITGNEWTLFTDEEKFDAVSNLMYLMSEENGWTFEYTETDYIDLINDFYSSGRLDIQFAGVFSSIKALEKNQ